MKVSPKPQHVIRTIRVDEDRVRQILQSLDLGDHPRTIERRTPRFPYRIKALIVHLQQPGDSSARPYLVATRNLSTGGLSFLHGGFVHAGTRCLAQLVAMDQRCLRVMATVARCRYLEAGLHEVAVRFDDPVDLRMFGFVEPPAPESTSEAVSGQPAGALGVSSLPGSRRQTDPSATAA